MLPDGNFPCELEDLSLGGACIRTGHRLERGRTVWIKLDNYEAFGTVIWAKDGRYGIEFEDRLPKVVVMQMQGHAVDPEEYEAAQSRRAARSWVVGEARAPKSRLIRLLDVLGPVSRDNFASCVQCDNGEPCLTHCGHKQYRQHRNGQRWRAGLFLGFAAAIGALIGIGSNLIR